ncbi:Transmembrane protein 214-B [Nymphon striatum]|nr:Transmembrane protein 214-B [Nymphon striatum]
MVQTSKDNSSILSGAPSTGFRIFIQYLGQNRSFVNEKMLTKLDASMKKYSNRSQVCLSLMWAAGQMGIKNFNDGLKVWLSLMFPMINLKSYSKYVIDYLVSIFNQHTNVKSSSDILGVDEFFAIMDYMFNNNSLPPNVFKQFKDLYPKFKEASFGRHPETVLHLFFPSFLQRLQPNASKALKKELLNCLTLCLKTDTHTFSVWRQLYTRNFVQSSILLEHLLQNWKANQKNLPVSMLKKTLSAFHVTNTELGSNQEGLNDCRKFVEGLLNKMSGTHFPWKMLSFVFLSIVGGLLAYDIHLHGEFQRSKTGALLKDSGLILVFNQAWTKINVYSNLTIEWTKNNVPMYLKTFTNTCEPYFIMIVEQLKNVCIFLVDYTEDGRNWISSQVHEMLILADQHVPKMYEKFLQIVFVALEFLKSWAEIIYTFIIYYYNILSTWIQVNVLTKDFNVESVQKVATDSMMSIQDFMTKSYSWLITQAKSVVG